MTAGWRQHPRLTDVALVVLLLLAASGPAMLNSDLSRTDNLAWWSAFPPLLAGSVATLWRRRCPRTVAVVTAVSTCVVCGVGYLVTPLLLAPVMVALYELTVRVPGPTPRWYLLAVTTAITGTALAGGDDHYPWPLRILNPVLFLLLPYALGEATRLRHDYVAAVQARAEAAERTREEEARHRVAEERVRIARDLHDVVAHHLALANAQAGTAAFLTRTRPDQAHRILTDLTGTTTAALRELKATVGLLRHADDPASPLEPAPGLARLPDLTAAFASSHLHVGVTVHGTRRPLPPGIDLTAFRIVQEALTNVAKHAGTDTAHVRLTYADDRLTITVTNDAGPAARTTGDGFGIIGMRERAHSAGGDFHAGPRPDGGFAVTTTLPAKAGS